jgi:sugar phosphate isomerase/epimerase
MNIGIFAKTCRRPTIEKLFRAISSYGISSVHFNLSCVGLETLPADVPSDLLLRIMSSARDENIELVAISGTFNMAHPEPSIRRERLKRLEILCEVARSLRIPVITLCTGTRDPLDMWKWHAENNAKEAWSDMVQSVECGLLAAEKNDVLLAVEPEKENVVNSAGRARRLLDELQHPRLRIVIDPANLIGPDVDQKKVLDESFDLLGASIVIAHAKDRDRAFQPCAAGKGILDFGYYSRCLKGIRFAGPLVLHGLTEEEIESSLNFLRRSLDLELS